MSSLVKAGVALVLIGPTELKAKYGFTHSSRTFTSRYRGGSSPVASKKSNPWEVGTIVFFDRLINSAAKEALFLYILPKRVSERVMGGHADRSL